jgi:hypothetical protein
MPTEELIEALRSADPVGAMQVLVVKEDGSGLTHRIAVEQTDLATLHLAYRSVEVNPYTAEDHPVASIVGLVPRS